MADRDHGVALSVCIPTHDGRCRELGVAIASVVDQLSDVPPGAVEVCISDNASSDGTEELVARARTAADVRIHYQRSDQDLGWAPNFLRSISLARAPWCWLLSSDDAIVPGGIARVLRLLGGHPTVAGATVNREAYDSELRRALPEPHPSIIPPPEDGFELLTSTNEVFVRVGLLLAFTSSQIVNRTLWTEALHRLGPQAVRRSRSVLHVAVIGTMLAVRPEWIWCSEPVVRQRTGNASLASYEGSIGRYMVYVSSDLACAWRAVPGLEAGTRRTMLERWRREAAGREMVGTIRQAPGHSRREDLRLLLGYARTFGSLPGFWTETVPALLAGPRDRTG